MPSGAQFLNQRLAQSFADIQAQIRVQPVQIAHHARHQVRSHAGLHAQTQGAFHGANRIARVVAQFDHAIEDVAGALGHLATGRSQHRAAAVPFGHRETQQILQAVDLRAQRRLADAQQFRRAPEVRGFGQRGQGAELLESWLVDDRVVLSKTHGDSIINAAREPSSRTHTCRNPGRQTKAAPGSGAVGLPWRRIVRVIRPVRP